MSTQGIDRIRHYFPELSADQLSKLERYVELLLEANDHVNLISRKSTEEVWINHILHSLAIIKVQDFEAGARVVDVGTGGGLPGIPLAICFPKAEFTLVDSIQKKTNAVANIAQALELENVEVLHARIEKVKEKFDYVVSRAVTALPKMRQLLQGRFRRGKKGTMPNGLIYIKGGDFEAELDEVARPYRTWGISDWFSEPFFETKKVVWIDLAS